MDYVELYCSFEQAPVYSDLGHGLIKVYFNEHSETVTVHQPESNPKAEAKQATQYTAWHVDVDPDYSHIISSIVRSKYSQDDVEAILCNHIEGRTETEYNDLVAWRAMARKVAENVMKAMGRQKE